jgi:hypothetical protein
LNSNFFKWILKMQLDPVEGTFKTVEAVIDEVRKEIRP